MEKQKAVVLFLLLSASQAILLMVEPKIPRCMVEYITSEGNGNSVKIKVDTEPFKQPIEHEHFVVSVRNTELNTTLTDIIKPGQNYHKENEMTPNVIYEVCILFRTDRQEYTIVDYDAQRTFSDISSKPVVPDHLLKKDDFREAYVSAVYLSDTIAEYRQDHKERQAEIYKIFATTQQVSSRVSLISTIQLVILLASGIYQFLTLRNYLTSKQYV